MADYIPASSDNNSSQAGDGRPWYKLLNRYHWFVLMVAALGWLFDTMDQQLFVLARVPAMTELLATPEGPPDNPHVQKMVGWATTIFMLGWATGGLFFGVIGDRVGRAKTMMITILMYSLFTGMSAFAVGFWDFALYRFLTGLGVGGEFAVGVALVAEVMPAKARPYALGLVQALSAVGNLSAGFMGLMLGNAESAGIFKDWSILGYAVTPWRIMFVIGVLPALLAIVIRMGLKEPEAWQKTAKSSDSKAQLGSYSELFGDPRWRKNALIGLAMACAGILGLWGIGFFIFDFIGEVLRKQFMAEGKVGNELDGLVTKWKGTASIMFNIGAFFGIYCFSYMSQIFGRKPAFAVSYIVAMLSTAFVFFSFNNTTDVYWMVPLAGFCILSLFGGYAIYFPELFPTRLRSTGTSFCYNVGRYVAAIGPAALGMLTSSVYHNTEEPLRWAGITMCSVFLIGLIALPFAPETKDQPLPE